MKLRGRSRAGDHEEAEAGVQNAKDTFYEELRGRLAAVNPERTVVLRGLMRPGVLVVENELVSAQTPADCFLLRWTDAQWDTRGDMPAVSMTCEVRYGTAGTATNGGMDRGRGVGALDAGLMTALSKEPRNVVKTNHSGASAVTMATRIWWGAATLGEVKTVNDRVQRTATVAVMSFEEAGEL